MTRASFEDTFSALLEPRSKKKAQFERDERRPS